ncbi:YycH family regulatory protein [Agrilactobacillus yilanensis]|uniref:YycH family regulatory protein n=1 Tax=Agrilactobacillus yilanensis TaxID=2485997 RepID=A0ABW4J6S3_9LACO|nr:two-component system activity regulator YycH [Agrilactobacillus yilanensis]
MGVKLSDVLLKVGLVLAIAVSIVLSFLIWTNNARYERNPNTKIASSQSGNETDHDLSDIYLPAQILKKGTTQQYMVYNRRENPNLSYKKEIQKWTIQKLKAPKSNTYDSYLDTVNGKHQVQLVYSDEITWRLFRKIYGLAYTPAKKDFKFNRIILKTNDLRWVYLGNDKNQKIYSVKVKDNQVEKLQKSLKDADLGLPVKEAFLNDQLTLFYTDTVEMTPYSYLISRENVNNYISTLLSANDNDTNIEARESGDTTTYYKGLYKKLSMDSSNGQVQYEDYTDTIAISSSTDLLVNGFKRLVNLGNSLTSVHYFSSDFTTKTVTYTSYVEGFPVFQDGGNTSIQLTPSGQILKFPSGTLQVPIPSESQDGQLPATENMLSALKNAGVDTTAIKGIQLGYRWTETKTNQQVIDLQPTYYIYINDAWKDYSDLLTEQGGGS